MNNFHISILDRAKGAEYENKSEREEGCRNQGGNDVFSLTSPYFPVFFEEKQHGLVDRFHIGCEEGIKDKPKFSLDNRIVDYVLHESGQCTRSLYLRQ